MKEEEGRLSTDREFDSKATTRTMGKDGNHKTGGGFVGWQEQGEWRGEERRGSEGEGERAVPQGKFRESADRETRDLCIGKATSIIRRDEIARNRRGRQIR